MALLNFTTQFTEAQREEIKEMALRVPTGDNAQPFDLFFVDDKVIILYSQQLGSHELNPLNYSTLLSLGALIQSLEIILSEIYGLKMDQLHLDDPFILKSSYSMDMSSENVSVNKKSDSKSDFQQIAVLKMNHQLGSKGLLINGQPIDKNLVSFEFSKTLLKRVTDRRPFKKQGLDPEQMRHVQKWEEYFTGVHVHFKESAHIFQNKAFFEFLKFADEYLWLNTKAIKDFFSWIRWSKIEVLQTRDGLSTKNLMLNFFQKYFMKLMFLKPHWISIFWKLSLKFNVNQVTKNLFQNSGHVYCISISKKNPTQLIEAGRLSFMVWLHLTEFNVGVQPMTISALISFYFKENQSQIKNIKDENKTEQIQIDRFIEGQNLLQSFFKSPKNSNIVWMFRVGYLYSDFPQSAKTLRRLKPV